MRFFWQYSKIQQNTDRIHSIQCSRILHLHAFEDDVVKNQKAKTVWCENKKTLISHSTLCQSYRAYCIINNYYYFGSMLYQPFFWNFSYKTQRDIFSDQTLRRSSMEDIFQTRMSANFLLLFFCNFQKLVTLYVMICFH